MIAQRVLIHPALEAGVVEAVAVVVESGAGVDEFGGEAVVVGGREGTADQQSVAKRVVPVLGGEGLTAVDHIGDVAIAISMVMGVGGPGAGGIAMGPSEHATDAACALEGAAQVRATSIGDGGDVGAVAVLNGQHAVVDVAGFTSGEPGAGVVGVLAGEAEAHLAVVNEFGFGGRAERSVFNDLRQLILIIVSKVAGSAGTGGLRGHVAVAIEGVCAYRAVGDLVEVIYGVSERSGVVGTNRHVPGGIVGVAASVGGKGECLRRYSLWRNKAGRHRHTGNRNG